MSYKEYSDNKLTGRVVDISTLSINTEAIIAFSVLMLVGYLLLKQLFCVFIVEFKKGKVKLTKGSVPPDFWEACTKLAANRQIKGSVFGYKTKYGVQLVFSANFPPLAKDKLQSAFPFQRMDKSFFRRKATHHHHPTKPLDDDQ
ncbi:hypothetical protein B3C1_07344 [Gallaecimonas xiamenensis 3-C-1]|uniref:Uncharacterized protein n=1 Tax=Gallaecimonas xiamenensis 3-C-1 TaxID=745411 RepID=K2JJH0_9GAMM|nr:hypothetical protein B3C1_07344 [Gallaecimonas xiamenensis 3-C-1]